MTFCCNSTQFQVLQFAVLKQSKVDFIRLAVNVVDIKVCTYIQRKINISYRPSVLDVARRISHLAKCNTWKVVRPLD